MSNKPWMTYEQVAIHLLDRMSKHFGVGRFEGKQVVSGSSGAIWELDGKGCMDSGSGIVVVECKRHVDRGINQATVAALAFTIRDLGADRGILVSPLGLQDGARKVASHANVVEVVLDQNSTTTDYLLSFLNQIHIGWSEKVIAKSTMIFEEYPAKR